MPKERTSRKSKRHEQEDRHKQLMEAYLARQNAPPRTTYVPSKYKTERDIIRENHKFVRSDDEDDEDSLTWEQKVAKRYYDRLYKEYALCDLKYYKEGRIALRWRTEKEVVLGKGQFICGSTRCDETKHLESWEVNFGYMEDGQKKNELVKLRLCADCSDKLNYKTKMKRAKKESRDKRRSKRARTKEYHSEDDETTQAKDEHISEDDEQQKESSVWSKKEEIKHEKSREEEYEDYFADLLQ